MESLKELLLEAPLKPDFAQQIINKKQRISLYYKGDESAAKGWRRFEPAFIDRVKGKNYLVGYEVDKSGKMASDRSRFDLEKIVNWNVLSVTPTTFDSKEDGPIVDAIVNKRVVSFYYKGDEEEAEGYRTGIEPVCYGKNNNIKYLRAWQKGGKSVSAEKGDTKRQLPSWRFFRVDRIRSWEPTGTETFTAPPAANFNPDGDKHMDTIIAIADFTKGGGTPPGTPPPGSSPSGPKGKGGEGGVKTEPKPSPKTPFTRTSGTEPEETSPEKPTKEPPRPGASKPSRTSKGAARPGAKSPERTGKGPARPGSLKESEFIGSILDAVSIL